MCFIVDSLLKAFYLFVCAGTTGLLQAERCRHKSDSSVSSLASLTSSTSPASSDSTESRYLHVSFEWLSKDVEP